MKDGGKSENRYRLPYVDESDPGWILKSNISGRDLVTGLPKTIEVSSKDMRSSRRVDHGDRKGVKATLETAPPELAADIINKGMVLAGGGSLLRGLDILIERETGILPLSRKMRRKRLPWEQV